MIQNSASAFADSRPHYPILDGLRGVAALVVVWYHVFEGYATSHYDQIINHGYLAVDFFFTLSGFVIAYAYDARWPRMTVGNFIARRLIRLHPMVIIGALIGAVTFYASSCAWWDVSHVTLGALLLATLLNILLLPATPGIEVRGLGEAYPLNGPSWSLFFEYIGNLCYALFIRRFSTRTLALWTAALALVWGGLTLTGEAGDVGYGWQFTSLHFPMGMLRMLLPFSIGLLMYRTVRSGRIAGGFGIGALLLIVLLAMPRVGTEATRWLNGLYEMAAILIAFPLIVWLGISSEVTSRAGQRLCKWLGDISYPLYIVHYPFIYLFIAWEVDNELPFSQAWPGAVGVMVVSVAIASLATRFYDIPVRRWLSTFLTKGAVSTKSSNK